MTCKKQVNALYYLQLASLTSGQPGRGTGYKRNGRFSRIEFMIADLMERRRIMIMEDRIREKALELGYEDCGIVRAGALAGFREKLEERIARIPMGERVYGMFRSYADPSAANPEI